MTEDRLKSALSRVLAPLVEADAGELYLVSDEENLVKIHLGGRFAGCPGNELVRREVLQPLIRAMRPQAELEVSSGAILPKGADRIRPEGV